MSSDLGFDIPDSPSQLFKFQKNRRLFFWWIFHRLTTPLRVLPDFLIIGVMKGGTTSLFQYLAKHPQINPPFRKEIKFFDLHYKQGLNWYRAHFPLKAKMTNGSVTGEATPYYIFHPMAAQRVAKDLPKAKLIVVLRNPVDRAYSHYNHMVRVGREKLSFDDALEIEDERLFQEEEKITSDPGYSTFKHLHYSYKARGRYVEQITKWLELFPREQMLFLSSEELYEQPSLPYGAAINFLGLPKWEPEKFKTFNQGDYDGLSAKSCKSLSEYFKPYNQQLYELLNMDFGWN
ncbi:MAG TPA: sulfotransferase domain-containing protein [Anaerolineales bacterium]|nr:sulfotransferase domain-containing protein [Anaerolineales bacterium]